MARPLLYLSFVFQLYLIGATNGSVNTTNWQLSPLSTKIKSMPGAHAVDAFKQYIAQRSRGTFTLWDMVRIAALCGAIPGIWLLQRQLRRKDNDNAPLQSTSRLRTEVAVNEDDPGGKHMPIDISYQSC
jgi:hypothetical protein